MSTTKPSDSVNRPDHYTQHPSGVECIQITEHMGFNLGNAMKYLWRADLKHTDAEEDLRKAAWYIDREIHRRRVLQEHKRLENAVLAGLKAKSEGGEDE